MSVQPVFSVVIPVFNNWELTVNCLQSLREHTPGIDAEVIVADNGSADDTAHALEPLGRSLFGRRFTRIRFEENRNFAPACNAGAKAASAPLLFFLNNDTLLTSGWAPPLLETLAADSSLAGVGPLLLYEDRTVQHLGVTFSLSGVEHLYSGFPADHPVVGRKRHFQVVTAAALMTPRELFLEHGGFYEEYRNGFEDVDFCLRLVQAGKRFTCVPESAIFHLESRTPGRKDAETHNSALLTRRCKHLFRSDKHLHGLRDGFRPFINDALGISLRLKDEDEAEFVRIALEQPPVAWHQICCEQPYWIRGREYLAELLEKHGHAAESLAIRTEVAAILRLAASSRDLMLAAARLGNAEILATAKADYQYLAERGQDKDLCRKLLRQAAGQGDARLEALYEEKLRDISR